MRIYVESLGLPTLSAVIGKKAEMVMLPLQLGDVTDTYADISDLTDQFNYKPYTPVEQGVAKFVTWYLDYFSSCSPLKPGKDSCG